MQIDELLNNTPTLNKISFLLTILAKVVGMSSVGFVLAGYYITAYVMLGIDGLFLFTAIILCLKEMGRQQKKDSQDEDIIRRLIKEGTLAARLREAGYSKCSSPQAASDTSPTLLN